MEKVESFSRCDNKDVFEQSGKVDGEWKGCGKKELEERVDFYFSFYLFDGLTDNKRTEGYQDEPVTENDPKGELIAGKRNKELS